jgi:hypothetical protein
MKLRATFISKALAVGLICGASVWLCPATLRAAGGDAKGKVISDALGKTIDYLDAKGRVVRSVRQDTYGPELGRETTTVYTYDAKGRKLSREIKNQLMHRVEYYDPQGNVKNGVQEDRFGVEWGRKKELSAYVYAQGVLAQNVETSKLETVTNSYNTRGQIIESRHKRNVGLGAKRETVVSTAYNPVTNLPLKQVEKNAYGVVETTAFDPVTLLPAKQMAKYNFGLGDTRETLIQYEWNPRTGLPKSRTETNRAGTILTSFDSSAEGTCGIPVKSVAENKFGLLNARHTETTWESDPQTGLPRRAQAVNKNETTTTEYDTLKNGLFGVPVLIVTHRNFGIGVKRYSETDVEVNSWNGLPKKTTEHFRKPPQAAAAK